jgi:prolipoprotein diacylglyceryl transferase
LEIGPLTIHYYALCILIGIAIAVWVGRVRYKNFGGDPEDISEAAVWAVPAGIIGGRIYHVITTPEKYFGENGTPSDALKIWEGGLGIWGAISLGAVAAYLYYRSHKTTLTFPHFLDAVAPGILLAQAIGRVGNWFNVELFGSPSTLPWALSIPKFDRPFGYKEFETFHPTFLYELIWCSALALLIIKMPIWLKKFATKPGDTFAIYVFGYTAGRLWIESLRIDSANLILGFRLNIWVSLLVLATSALYLYKSRGYTKNKIANG